MTDQTRPTGSNQPTGQAQPTGNEQPTNSGQQAGRERPIDHNQPAGQAQSTGHEQPAGHDQPAGQTRPVGREQPTDGGQSTGHEQLAGHNQPTGLTRPADHNQPVSQARPSGYERGQAVPAGRERLAGRVRLTGRGVGALVLGALLTGLGVWWRYPGMIGFGAALTALVAAGFGSVLRPIAVQANRGVRPRTVHRLGSCTGTLELTSLSRRFPVQLDAVDQVGATPVGIDVPLLAPGERMDVEYPIPTTRRGILRVGPLTLRRNGLAGLAESRTVLGETVDVRVVPRVLPVRGLPTGVRRGHVGADERVERGGTDLVGLREYVPGDDLRRLHWATSARTGTLMVREDADPARPHLAVILDDRPDGHPDPDGFEDAVEVAASLLTEAVDAGHPVRLLSTSGSVDLEIPASAGADPALAALADLQITADGSRISTVPIRDLDVVAAICGSAADLSPLLLEVGRASVGVILVVDTDSPAPSVSATSTVLILRAHCAEDLLKTWDSAVSK
jgi:uncharacterized protein (DUF58 family)